MKPFDDLPSPSTTAPFHEPAPDDDRVVEALEEYLKEQESGQRIDPAAFAARYPDIADILTACLEGMEFVRGAGRVLTSSSGNGPTASLAPATAQPLGDFRLIRELGRGGMGVVYEAEQLSLGRRVALKVLPLAATLDPRRLQRFKNEVQAAAALHHANIVPVYFVGCERGVHYYAMQLIPGQTLAQVIHDLRRERDGNAPPSAADTPARAALTTERSGSLAFCRAVARLGVQAAEALEHAHQLGVVHRDIKPSNLMLDARGRLWVADFGLARLPGDPGLTMSGDLVGTLRYMSPEQALAKRLVLDHRTDIYSLGATLYELLTLAPVFDGSDREELLRQFAFEEPLAPRRLNKAIPADLEAIILKALEKSPGDRYASAQELADDLERHLKDQPIRARRPGLRVRLSKWARRHRPLVAGLASAAAILVIALVVGAFWYGAEASRLAAQRLRLNAQIGDALAEAGILVNQAPTAGRQQASVWARAREATGRAETLAENNLADPALVERVRTLRQKLDEGERDQTMVAWLEIARQPPLNARGDASDVKWSSDQYATAFRKYGIDVEALPVADAAAGIAARAIRLPLVAALDDWAAQTGDQAQRLRFMQIARAADNDPWRDQVRTAFLHGDVPALRALSLSAKVNALPAPTLLLLGRTLHALGEPAMAADFLRRAQAAHPGDFWISFRLGLCLLDKQPRLPAEAIAPFTAAAALRPDSAIPHNNLANVLAETGQLDAAIAHYRQALRLQPGYAAAHGNLGSAYMNQGQMGDAIREFREAIRLDKDLPTPYCNLGNVLRRQGEVDEAIVVLRRAIQILDDFPEAHLNLGRALADKGELDDASAEYEHVIKLNKTYVVDAHLGLAKLLDGKGQRQAALNHYADAHLARGDDLHLRKDASGAIAEYRQVLDLRPDDADAYCKLGFVLTDKKDFTGAADAYRSAIRLQPDKPRYHNYLGGALLQLHDLPAATQAFRQAIRLQPDLAFVHSNLGLALSGTGHLDEAIAEYREAIKFDKEDPLPYFRMASAYREMGDFRSALDAVRCGNELGARHPAWRGKSEPWVREHERLVELDTKLTAILEKKAEPANPAERIELAEISTLKKLPAAAAQFYEDAFTAEPGLLTIHRYKAACAAALCGCGQGKGASKLDEPKRAHLRAEALGWLRAELAKLSRQQGGGTASDQQLRRWQRDPALAGVRDPAALAELPAAEQRGWRDFWSEVASMLHH